MELSLLAGYLFPISVAALGESFPPIRSPQAVKSFFDILNGAVSFLGWET